MICQGMYKVGFKMSPLLANYAEQLNYCFEKNCLEALQQEHTEGEVSDFEGDRP